MVKAMLIAREGNEVPGARAGR